MSDPLCFCLDALLDILILMQVLDTYISHPTLPPTDFEGSDYVEKTQQTGTGGSSSSAGARPDPVSTLPPPDR